VRRVAVTALLLGVLTGCEDRFPAGAVYSAASNTSLQFGRDKDGKVLRLRPIGALDDAVTSIRISSMNDSTILVVASGARANLARVNAQRLKDWVATVETWVNSPSRPEPGAHVREKVVLEPLTSNEVDDQFLRLEISRLIRSPGGPNYWVYLTVGDVSVWLRRLRPNEVGRFVAALGEASDSSLAMSGRE